MKNNLFIIILTIIFIIFLVLFLGTNFYEGYVNMPSNEPVPNKPPSNDQHSNDQHSNDQHSNEPLPNGPPSNDQHSNEPLPNGPPSNDQHSNDQHSNDQHSNDQHSKKTNINITSKVFYGTNGTQATIITDDNNNIDSIVVINPTTGTSVFIPNNNNNNKINTYTLTSNTYIDQNGNTAKIVKDSNGNTIIKINYQGNIVIFTNILPNGGYTNNDYNNSNYSNYSNSMNDISSSTEHVSSNNIDKYTIYTSDNNHNNIDDNNITNITPNNNNPKPLITNYDSSSYYNSKQGFNNGIRASEIPKGSEDLYILKSQVVPPVCPICPSPIIKNCENSGKCPPCPAPQRCPSQDDFICKKEPNYQNINSNVQKMLPLPVLNSFSSFGM